MANDSASSMAGCKTGVATTIYPREPGHALNLAVQEVVKKKRKTICFEIPWTQLRKLQKLIKRSPKRETIF